MYISLYIYIYTYIAKAAQRSDLAHIEHAVRLRGFGFAPVPAWSCLRSRLGSCLWLTLPTHPYVNTNGKPSPENTIMIIMMFIISCIISSNSIIMIIIIISSILCHMIVYYIACAGAPKP